MIERGEEKMNDEGIGLFLIVWAIGLFVCVIGITFSLDILLIIGVVLGAGSMFVPLKWELRWRR